MHRLHAGYTLAVAIKKGQSAQLKCLLQQLNGKGNAVMPNFAKSPSTLFVSGVVLPAEYYGKEELPATFVFATTYCGPLATHLNELISHWRIELMAIFDQCELGKNKPHDDKSLLRFLYKKSHSSAFNSRYNCITKADVPRESELRSEIEEYLDKAKALHAFYACTAKEVKTLIQRHILTRGPKYNWAKHPDRKSLLEVTIINRGFIIVILILLLLLRLLMLRPRYILPVLFGIAACRFLLNLVLKHISSDENDTAKRPCDAKVRSIAATQLRPVINEMTAAGPLKRGWLRRMFYKTALRVIKIFAPWLMKVPTVSNIRWLVVNDSKRLLFMPNYSNATDFYVRDFLNGKTPLGVNFMFTNGKGFPDAKMLRYGGISNDPEGYMHAVHTGQQVTDLWYAHDHHLTSDIINRNRKVRNGLFKKMNEAQAKDWLKLL